MKIKQKKRKELQYKKLVKFHQRSLLKLNKKRFNKNQNNTLQNNIKQRLNNQFRLLQSVS